MERFWSKCVFLYFFCNFHFNVYEHHYHYLLYLHSEILRGRWLKTQQKRMNNKERLHLNFLWIFLLIWTVPQTVLVLDLGYLEAWKPKWHNYIALYNVVIPLYLTVFKLNGSYADTYKVYAFNWRCSIIDGVWYLHFFKSAQKIS